MCVCCTQKLQKWGKIKSVVTARFMVVRERQQPVKESTSRKLYVHLRVRIWVLGRRSGGLVRFRKSPVYGF